MAKTLQAIRGMNDTLPEDIACWQHIEDVLRKIAANYHYTEVRFPIVEQTALFKRTVGEATDIVEKEMYTFEDRNGDSLSLRPEGTAPCARAGIQHGLLYNQTQRLHYCGPMFRHERPQKGRCRQFHQFGVEAFGMPGPYIDAEQIFLSARIWQALGLSDHVALELNSLGTSDCRKRYREVLVDYLRANQDGLDEDSQRRLETNPMRILDSKNKAMKGLIEAAPKLIDYLDEPSQTHFDGLRKLLDEANLNYRVNPNIVRGLDYYCYTVYEWVTDELGSQGTICAGGRYDSLVEQLGGKPTPAVGFALGLERIVLMLQEKESFENPADIYLILQGETASHRGLLIAEQLRDALPDRQIACNCGGGSFKAQFKRADKSGAELALILGERELDEHRIAIKNLRNDQEQCTIPLDDLIKTLRDYPWLEPETKNS